MAKNTAAKREKEKELVSQMILLYCKKKHGVRQGLCADCAELDSYARLRSDKCPFIGFTMMLLKGLYIPCIILAGVWVFHIVYFIFGIKTLEEECGD